jgi:hypothetical protein
VRTDLGKGFGDTIVLHSSGHHHCALDPPKEHRREMGQQRHAHVTVSSLTDGGADTHRNHFALSLSQLQASEGVNED